uniref:Cyclin D3 n=1 Tax=Strigops habroptila TaxID=2489341 RepID=A0A672UJF3_STRHB
MGCVEPELLQAAPQRSRSCGEIAPIQAVVPRCFQQERAGNHRAPAATPRFLLGAGCGRARTRCEPAAACEGGGKERCKQRGPCWEWKVLLAFGVGEKAASTGVAAAAKPAHGCGKRGGRGRGRLDSSKQRCLQKDTSSSSKDWEILVLEKLKWDLVSVIANDFLAHILYRLPLPKDKMELVKKHAQTFIALCATDYTFAMYPPSMIATGSIGAAIHGLTVSVSGFSGEAMTELLASITGTEVDCLKACQEQIEAALAESLKQASQTPQELRATKSAAYPGSQPTGTPTDVTDVNL